MVATLARRRAAALAVLAALVAAVVAGIVVTTSTRSSAICFPWGNVDDPDLLGTFGIDPYTGDYDLRTSTTFEVTGWSFPFEDVTVEVITYDPAIFCFTTADADGSPGIAAAGGEDSDAARPSTFSSELKILGELRFSSVTTGTAAVLAAALVVLVSLPAELLQSTVGANYNRAFRWLDRLRGRLKTVRDRLPLWLTNGPAGATLVTRLADIQPGFLFGLVVGVLFARELTQAEDGRLALLATGLLFALGIGAWLVFSALPAECGYLMQFTRDLFAATTLEALSTLIVDLLPLAFVDGGAIFAWSKRAWLATYVAAVFAFVVIVLPMGDSWGEISAPLLGWVAMFAGFAVVAVGVWAYFRFVPEKSREEVGAGAR